MLVNIIELWKLLSNLLAERFKSREICCHFDFEKLKLVKSL